VETAKEATRKRVVVASATAIVLAMMALTVTIAVQGRDGLGPGARRSRT